MLSTQMSLSETAFFGGTFDPIHRGHLFLLYQASLLTPFKRVIISPVSINNFKADKIHPTSGKDRLNMISLSLMDYKELYPDSALNFIVNDSDIKKGGVSYAFETIKDVKTRYGINGKIGYFVGDDILPTLNRWYKIEELLDEVEFFVFTRNKETLSENVTIPVHLVQSKIWEESSTDIRAGNYDGLSYRVREYVQNHKLYKA